jgi:hypothetical protein
LPTGVGLLADRIPRFRDNDAQDLLDIMDWRRRVIVASWTDLVTPAIGWAGFGVDLLITILPRVAQGQPRPERSKPPEEW